MDTLANVRTFLLAARLGSFAAAARSLQVAPSVVSKRIGQLEHELDANLFHRSTRQLALTAEGSRLLSRCQKLVAAYDELSEAETRHEVRGHLRIDAPGTVTTMLLGPIICEFLARYPDMEIDLRLVDRLGTVIDKDCDIAIGVRPSVFEDVVDVPLIPYPNATYASREYVEKHGAPNHPRELVDHSCLTSLLYGTVWHFYGESGDFAVTVYPRFSVNDSLVLREAVRSGLGIAILPTSLVEEDLESGKLRPLLPDFRPLPLWLKALVPAQNVIKPSVRVLLDFLRERLPQSSDQAYLIEEFADQSG